MAAISGCTPSATTSTSTSQTIVSTDPIAVTSSGPDGGPNPPWQPDVTAVPTSSDQTIPTETTDPQPITSAPPTSTPAPTLSRPVAGTPFPGEGLTAQQSSDLQKSVDGGHQAWRLDEIQVAKTFAMQRFGWTNVQANTGPFADIIVITNQDNGKVALHCSQPVTIGSRGIWVVDSGTWN
ncbi:hypothetical protein [Nocardia sp. CDC160]|uniref:hypothetical protein n=1 Tax=Nocardia sp. CDC160 TaxID=3112166 RepID=UPI002DB85EE1|nr:hypothetical protein [Nocardia sp. CDC160]MEC3920243.1 hypothetical protein [Nocardia sp. CDC160]